jgi:polysaccharide deacetylase family protein (PEP-CTERM system associated)
MTEKTLNCFTVDVEDYFHICGLPEYCDPARWKDFPARIEGNTTRLLDLLDRFEVKATFFCLGWVGQNYPHLIREIASRGHEIASHGHHHRLVYEMSPEEFREDLQRSIEVLEQAGGQRIRGFRATSFSITAESLWALEIIAELGLDYDASLFPASRGHGGMPGEERFLHRRTFGNGKFIWEFPMSTRSFLGWTVPFTGGGYLRLFPTSWIQRGVAELNAAGQPAIFYVHPREIDPGQPRLRMPLHRKFKCYINLGKTGDKLASILGRFQFVPVGQLIDSQEA